MPFIAIISQFDEILRKARPCTDPGPIEEQDYWDRCEDRGDEAKKCACPSEVQFLIHLVGNVSRLVHN